MSSRQDPAAEKERRLGIWEKYLSLWVALCIGVGIGLGELFSLQGSVITKLPAVVGMIAIGIFCNILLVFVLTYIASKFIHLSYEDAVPTAIIAGSNHFEVAVAVATTVFGMALPKDTTILL